ncbi:hypothetical protein Tco_0542253 [Tanacetum coccineum]
MAALESCPKHNMVAYLEKTEGSAPFHEIVDFLSRSSIFYALTTVLLSESSIRCDLLFNDDNGIDCLTVTDIYENLLLMGSKSTSWDQFPTNIASAVICLATNRTFNFSKMIFDGMNRNLEAKKKFLMYPRKGLHFLGHVTPLFHTMLVYVVVEEGEGSGTYIEPQPTPSPTQPSGHTSDKAEGGLNLEELFVLCTNLSNRFLALETSKDAQATKILKLKSRIKKLEKKSKPSISHHRAWLRSVSSLSMKKKFGKKESVSKQGRKNAKPGPTLDDSAFDDLDADLAHGMDYMETEEAVNEGRQSKEAEELNVTHNTEVLKKRGSNEEPVNVVGNIGVSTVVPEVSTINISTASRPKEEPKPVNVKLKGQDKAQIAIDEEVARQLDEQLQAELERERVAEEEATKAALIREYDEIQARINADSIVVARLQEEEREKFTVEEKAKFLHDTIATQRKFLAEQRAAAIRNKPPTKSQLKESVQDFVPIGSARDKRRIEEMSKKAASKDASKNIKGSPRMKRMSKRKKTDSDHEDEEQLKTFLKIVSDEEGIIDYERFETTTPEGVDLALWGDLRTMIHTLILEDGTEIHMLTERKYPLTKETLEKMMSLKLVVESASDGAYNLFRFIQKQIDESGSYDGSEKDL